MTPTTKLRWIMRETLYDFPGNELLTTRQKVLQQWHALQPPYNEPGEWRDVPLETEIESLTVTKPDDGQTDEH
jgi:hypothetical protein